MLKRLLRNQDGATSIEFAILAIPFLMTLFASLEVGYKAIIQTELDTTLFQTSEDLAILSFDQDTPEKFIEEYICDSGMTTFLKCSEIEIGVRVIPLDQRLVSLRETSIIGDWDTGCAYDALLIEFNYPLTNVIHPIVTGEIVMRNGEKFYRSRALVRREPVVTGAGAC